MRHVCFCGNVTTELLVSHPPRLSSFHNKYFHFLLNCRGDGPKLHQARSSVILGGGGVGGRVWPPLLNQNCGRMQRQGQGLRERGGAGGRWGEIDGVIKIAQVSMQFIKADKAVAGCQGARCGTASSPITVSGNVPHSLFVVLTLDY